MLGAPLNLAGACGCCSDKDSCHELLLPHLTELWLLAPGEMRSFEHLPGGLPALRTLVVSTEAAVHGGCLGRLTGLEALDVSESAQPLWPPSINTRPLTEVCYRI